MPVERMDWFVSDYALWVEDEGLTLVKGSFTR